METKTNPPQSDQANTNPLGPDCVSFDAPRTGKVERLKESDIPIGAIRAAMKPADVIKRQTDAYEEWERKQFVSKCLEVCGVLPKYRNATLGDDSRLPPELRTQYAQVIATVRKLIDRGAKEPRIVCITGEVGTGKTAILSALVIARIRAGDGARYIDARDIVEKARAAVGYEASRWMEFLNTYSGVRLLCIDEAIAGASTQFGQEKLEHLIDRRYANGLDTVIASNGKPEALATALGQRVIDRANEAGGIVVMGWSSLRGRIAAA